jgi:hypothetical protein
VVGVSDPWNAKQRQWKKKQEMKTKKRESWNRQEFEHAKKAKMTKQKVCETGWNDQDVALQAVAA